MPPKKNRALLPPEDDDEGYVKQPASTPAPSNPPAATNNSAVDDDEGYVTQPAAPPHQPTATATTTATTGEQKVYDPDLDDYVYPSQQKKNQTPAATAVPAAGGGLPGEQKVYDADLDDYVYPSQQKKNQPPAEPSFDQPANATNYNTPATNNAPNNNNTAPVNGSDAQNPQKTKTPKINLWQTKMIYDEGIPATECLYGFFCYQCAQASAKSDMDGTHWLYNCCCWHHGMTYNWFRSVYEIESNCGSDMMSAVFCACCSGRRLLSEVRIRKANGQEIVNVEKEKPVWIETLFGCSGCGFAQACFCAPCQAHEARMFLQNPQELDCCFDVCCLNPCAMYGQVRHQYNISHSVLHPVFEDLCVPFACCPCALNRAVREARAYKKA